MENEEILSKIQAVADESAAKFIRPSKLTLIHTEVKPDGSTEALVLGSDMPLLVYRVFNISADGNTVEEINDIKYCVDQSRHYTAEVKPTLKLVPPDVEEQNDYEILVENKLATGAIEAKLKSTTGRDVTMIEIYRYFDFVSRIFFVTCIGTSFGGQYLFSVTPDSKHLKLIVGNNEAVRSRVNMLSELLQARLLPSYQTIAAAGQLLSGEVKAHIKIKNDKGIEDEFDSNFCYDDEQTQTRFVFFANSKDAKKGLIIICDIFDNNKLIFSDKWTEEQKAAVDRIKALMTSNPEEFQKRCCSFFADDLDFRYAAFKSGPLKPNTAAAPAAEEKKAA